MNKNILKNFLCVAMLAILFAVAVPSAAHAEDQRTLKATTTVNIRSGNGTNYSILGCIPAGETCTAGKRSDNNWYNVTYHGISGWSSGDYLTEVSASGSSSSSSSASSSASASGNTAYTLCGVNVRSGASTDSSILTTLPTGAKVTWTESKNCWYKISADGTTGWVSGYYLSNKANGSPLVTDGSVSGTAKTTDGVNMRSSASTSSSIITVVPAGTTVTLVEGKDGWYKCTWNGKTGWIYGQYLK